MCLYNVILLPLHSNTAGVQWTFSIFVGSQFSPLSGGPACGAYLGMDPGYSTFPHVYGFSFPINCEFLSSFVLALLIPSPNP